ncbi:hypothetical protein GOP47_0011619 [Adiantum capillus-veneris]|uniref:Coilin n=1 Tax=Adiantum capillus-veneris TaxID=13818 RepID=A0A9D4UTM4_ADICA|nr:hypothetical protein GOP47_0011619 [Adiantum capillus-veneris]
MELAVVSDSAIHKQQVRLKLHFEDATILSAQQIHEGLCDSWFVLGRQLHSMADLASHIMIAFGLRSSCPHGISLRMENFTLPPSQPVELLKDRDIVSINRKGAPFGAAHEQGKLAYSSSFDTIEKIAPLGVKAPAIEEFERETGGYESEQEEEKDISKDLLKEGVRRMRNREKVERKRIPSSATCYKGKPTDSSCTYLETNVTDNGLNESKAKSREKKRKRAEVECSPDEEVKHKEKTPGLHSENEIVKKCSRSSTRKKAKRRWKQEKAKLQTKITSGEGDDPVEVGKTGTEQAKHEDDGDAEEERLPRVVRPGHLRFQYSDEDKNDSLDPQQKPLPNDHWSTGISKRKGQSWGQEKTKRGNNYLQALDDTELDDIQELEPETLPAVEGMPQNGDVIAYRILELTNLCRPELSEYRVGRVLHLESQSGKVKLAEAPNYRTQKHNDQEPSFYKGGILETEISSLSEVRLVERSNKLEYTVQASVENLVNERDLHVATDATLDISFACNGKPNAAEVEQIEKSGPAPFEGWLGISDALQRKREELGREVGTPAVEVSKHGSDQEIENEHRPESQIFGVTTATRIVDLTNNGQVNKELANKEETAFIQNRELEKQNGKSSSSAGKDSKIVGAGKARGWHRKAGGLGSTMALLRSQNSTL